MSKRVPHQSPRQLRRPRKQRRWRFVIPAFVSLIAILYVFVVISSSRIQKTHDVGKPSMVQTLRKMRNAGSTRKRGVQMSQNNNDTGTRESPPNIHILFSTSCSSSQDWQSYLFFYSMMAVKQTGNVTRLVSGCSEEERAQQKGMLDMIQSTMSPRFNYFFTDLDFGKKYSLSNGDWHDYKYMNKPFSTLAFFQEVLGFPDRIAHENDLIVLMDPDMMALRSFENHFHSFVSEEETVYSVNHGHMFGQPFAYDTVWYDEAKDNLTYLLGTSESPVNDLHGKDLHYYHAGPPYMATGRDFYSLIKTWCDILPRFQKLRHHMMVEMYSASLAAAHLGLPFHLVKDFMVSNDDSDDEGWVGIDKADPCDLCTPSRIEQLPLVFHYCQRFGLGEFFFNKHIFNNNFFSCKEPLMKHVPHDVTFLYNYSHYGDGTNKTWTEYEYHRVKRNAFMLCTMTAGLNNASTFFKKNHCGFGANYEQTWNFHEAKARGEIG